MHLGKNSSQELHCWFHWYNETKWQYWKKPNSGWWYFYNALYNHTTTSEKIVNLYYSNWTVNDGTDQIWAYIKRYNRK